MAGNTLADKLAADQKEATKSRDKFRLSVIRMLRAELQNEVIKKRAPLDQNEEMVILTREVKRRKEALTVFEKSGREDLIRDLKLEIELLSKYLPEQLTENELVQMVKAAIEDVNATGIKDIGKVLGSLMPKIKGKTDGNIVRQLVEKHLQ